MTKCTRPGCEEEALFQLLKDARACRSCWIEWTGDYPTGDSPFQPWADAHPKPAHIDWLSRYAAEAIAEPAEPAKPAAPKDWRWLADAGGVSAVVYERQFSLDAGMEYATDVAVAHDAAEAQDFVAAHNQAVDALTAERDEARQRLSALSDDVCTVADENGGPHPVQTADDALRCIEERLFITPSGWRSGGAAGARHHRAGCGGGEA